MEVTHVESWRHARGTQIGLGYELRWELDGEVLAVELVGGGEREFKLGDADFFDVLASPFFNSLPVVRDGLLDGGSPRDYVMSFVRHPELTAAPSHQRYTPLGNRIVRYSSGAFEADIEFGADSFVSVYQGYLERIA